MNIIQIRTFVPSRDFDISKQFYQDLGFEILWNDHKMATIGTTTQNFFLQDYYVKEWANNVMLQMFVDDLDELYNRALPLMNKYEGSKIKPIFKADYGRTFHLGGPAGELWHMTESQNKKSTR